MLKKQKYFFSLIMANLEWSKACTAEGRRQPVLQWVGSRTFQDFCTPAALNVLAQMNISHHLENMKKFPCSWDVTAVLPHCIKVTKAEWAFPRSSACEMQSGEATFTSPRPAVNWRPKRKPELLWAGQTRWASGVTSRNSRARHHASQMTLTITPLHP